MTQPAEARPPVVNVVENEAEGMPPPGAEAAADATADEAIETPTWFSRTYHDQSPEDLAQAYEARRRGAAATEADALPPLPPAMPVRAANELEMTAFRRLLEERLQAETARRAVPPAQAPAPAARPRPVPPRRAPLPLSELARQVAPRQAALRTMSPTTAAPRRGGARVAMAALGALAIGGAFGFGMARQEMIAQWWQGAVARVAALSPVSVAPPAPPLVLAEESLTPLPKPVETVSLLVQDVEGSASDPIPLGLVSRDSDVTTPIALKVMGVPEDARLTAGQRMASGEWLVPAADIGRTSLVVADAATPEIGLSVAAVEAKSGELAAPMQEMTVALHPPGVQISPAAGPPEQPADGKLAMTSPGPQASAPEPSPEAEGLVQKGRMLLEAGDLAAARPFLSKAEALGSGEAALALGQSYDPATFIRLKVQGLTPDEAQARNWYEKARAAGVTEAEAALAALDKAGQP